MPEILIASQNRWKVKLFAPMFQGYGFQPVSLKDIVTTGERPPENGDTVIENALQKARFYQSAKISWTFADDTGLEIDALNGEPGVEFRRWRGRFLGEGQDQEWLDYLLERMQAVPPQERTACFVSGWALIDPSGSEHTYQFRMKFEIATTPVRQLMPGSPVMAVALGLPEDMSSIVQQAKARLDEWGILSKLLEKTL